MSKTRKSIKAARKDFHANGTAINATNCPATSSITTICGSFIPEPRATWVAAGIPISTTSKAKAIAIGVRKDGTSAKHNAAHSNTVAAEAHVPGPGRSRPIPKNVATSEAQSGVVRDAVARTGGTPALVSGSRVSFTILRPRLRAYALGSVHPRPLPAMELRKRRLPTCQDQWCGNGHCRRETRDRRSSPFSCRSGSGASGYVCEASVRGNPLSLS
jgi:hypothetical protein